MHLPGSAFINVPLAPSSAPGHAHDQRRQAGFHSEPRASGWIVCRAGSQAIALQERFTLAGFEVGIPVVVQRPGDEGRLARIELLRQRPVVIHAGDGHLSAAMQYQEAVNLRGAALLKVALNEGSDFAGPLVAGFYRVVSGGFAQFDGAIDEVQMLAEYGVLMIGIADVGVGVAGEVDTSNLGHRSFLNMFNRVAMRLG